MRCWLLLLFSLLGGCAGHLADYVGPRQGIVTPQLFRYGYNLVETRCVSEALAASLTPLQLRLFARAAGAVRQGYYQPERLTVRDLVYVAGAYGDAGVRQALIVANAACGVRAEEPAAIPDEPPAAAEPAQRPRIWLNLGAADSGQSIAIDASTIVEEGDRRYAWFRLTEPDAKASRDTFLLDIDCRKRTINPKERQRLNEDGSVADRVEYPDNPLAVEDGTVMRIAWLSLCT